MDSLSNQIKQQYPTWQDFVVNQDPSLLLINYDTVNKITDVYYATPVTLEFLNETYPLKDSSAGLYYLVKWLTFLNDFLNINKGIQQKFIHHLAFTLYSKYKYFKLADLKLLFDFILESRYGTFYGSVDTQRIVSSFFEYNRERNEIFTKIEERINEEAKKLERQNIEYHEIDFTKYKNLTKLFGK